MRNLQSFCVAALLACPAFAGIALPWFDGGLGEGWPTNGVGLCGGAWSNTVDQATYADGKVAIAAAANSPVAFVADAAQTVSKTDGTAMQVMFNATVRMTPFYLALYEDPTLLPVPEGSEIGIVVNIDQGATNYYCIAAGVWTNAGEPYDDENPANVKIVVVDTGARKEARYYINRDPAADAAQVVTEITGNTLQSANFVGDCELSALDATYVADAEPVVPGSPIEIPDNVDPVAYAQEINAEKASILHSPADVLTGDGLATYQGFFVAVPDGGVLRFVMNEAGTGQVEQATSDIAKETLKAALDPAGAALVIDAPLVGFYYSLKQGGALTNLGFRAAGDRNKLAGRDAIEFTIDAPAGAGFYQPIVTPVPYEDGQ